MKYKILFALACWLLNSLIVYSQVPLFEKQWDKKFGAIQEEIIGAFHITPDSGFMLAG